MTPNWLLPAISILGAILMALFGYVLKLTGDVSGIRHELDLCKLGEIRTSVDMLTCRQDLADKSAAAGLHAPTHFERDDLVDRLLQNELTDSELTRLVEILRQASKSEKSSNKRYWAGQLLSRAETELIYRRRPDGHCV